MKVIFVGVTYCFSEKSNWSPQFKQFLIITNNFSLIWRYNWRCLLDFSLSSMKLFILSQTHAVLCVAQLNDYLNKLITHVFAVGWHFLYLNALFKSTQSVETIFFITIFYFITCHLVYSKRYNLTIRELFCNWNHFRRKVAYSQSK